MYDKETETVVFNFPNTLPKGNATLELKFTGELNDKMKGFYRSKYTTQAGEEKYMGVTQFEVISCYHELFQMSSMPVYMSKSQTGLRLVFKVFPLSGQLISTQA